MGVSAVSEGLAAAVVGSSTFAGMSWREDVSRLDG